MQIPGNRFKAELRTDNMLLGLWLGLGETFSAEICAGAGFDWLLIDGEHGPNDLRSILAQLQAIEPYPSQAVVRPPQGDHVLIKQLLETGVQTLLIPMVETAEQAAGLVRAMRYPPAGIRGVGAALARASRWGRINEYSTLANEQMCLPVQVETRQGYGNLDPNPALAGAEGAPPRPAPPAPSQCPPGESNHPSIVEAIENGLRRARAAGRSGGVLCSDKSIVARYLAAGARFIAVGVDALLLAAATSELRLSYKPGTDEKSVTNY